MQNLLPVLVGAALLMAGCADSAAPVEGPPTGAPPTMTVIGLVQDVGFNGIAGAQVSLRLVNHTTTTDVGGGFRFEGLPISAYLVDVNATGYEPATLTAEPQVGANASLNFILSQLESLRPSVTLFHFKGIFECASETFIITGSCDLLLEDQTGQSVVEDISKFQLGLNRNWQSIAVDVDFDLGASPGIDALRLSVRGLNDADKLNEYQQYGRFSGSDPFTAILNVNGTYPDGDAAVPGNLTALELVVYPQGYGYHEACDPRPEGDCFLGVGAGIDVQFDLYVSVFYNQFAPEGYTLRPA